MENGSAVKWEVNATHGDGKVLLIGEIEEIKDNVATVREAHAFSVWGGSNAMRGTLHFISLQHLEPASGASKRIVERELPKWKAKHLDAPMVD